MWTAHQPRPKPSGWVREVPNGANYMRFLHLLAAFALLIGSLYVAGIFGPASYASVEQLRNIRYYESLTDGPLMLALPLSPARYATFRVLTFGVLGASLLSTIVLVSIASYRQELADFLREVRRAGAALWHTIQALSKKQLVLATGLLMAVLSARLFWFFIDPLSPDEVTSFTAFVHEGPLAVTSFYPIPNNHVFYNFLSWVVSKGGPGDARVIMRLPSLLIATAGTALSYVMLTRRFGFKTATIVTTLFDLTQLTIIYAASGRGYYLQLVCIQVGFFCVLKLLMSTHYTRLGWALFVFSSLVGLYAIPTYAAPFASFLLVLLASCMTLPPQIRGPFGRQVLTAGLIIGATTLVLYSPVGCVSGWSRLLANRYLTPTSLDEFTRVIRAYIYDAAMLLFGMARPALIVLAALLGLTPIVLWRTELSATTKRAAWTCWALLLVPIVLMLLQRRFIPARVLIFTTYFAYLLVTLGAAFAAQRWKAYWVARIPLALLVVLLTLRVGEMVSQIPAIIRTHDREAGVGLAYRWLLSQPKGEVFLQAPLYGFMFYHYNSLDTKFLAADSRREAGKRYTYLVVEKNQPTLPEWAQTLPYHAVYEDELARIYVLNSSRN